MRHGITNRRGLQPEQVKDLLFSFEDRLPGMTIHARTSIGGKLVEFALDEADPPRPGTGDRLAAEYARLAEPMPGVRYEHRDDNDPSGRAS